MPERITLMGSEDVSRAGYVMRDAAQEMHKAASIISEALHSQRLFMDDWMQRFEAAMTEPVDE